MIPGAYARGRHDSDGHHPRSIGGYGPYFYAAGGVCSGRRPSHGYWCAENPRGQIGQVLLRLPNYVCLSCCVLQVYCECAWCASCSASYLLMWCRLCSVWWQCLAALRLQWLQWLCGRRLLQDWLLFVRVSIYFYVGGR